MAHRSAPRNCTGQEKSRSRIAGPVTVLGLTAALFLVAGMAVGLRRQGVPAHLKPEPHFTRFATGNPVLSPRMTKFADPMSGKPVAWEANHVFNPAAITRNGKLILLYRAEDLGGKGIGEHTSRIGYAESADGIHFTRRPNPVLFPTNDDQKQYDWPGGCEDPRVIERPGGGYVVTYTAWNRKLARLSAATSPDLIHWHKTGPVFTGAFRDVWSKSGAIVTKLVGGRYMAAKIKGHYWMYFGEGKINVAESTDLLHWHPLVSSAAGTLSVAEPRASHFDSELCESGPPAVLEDGVIRLIYNGKNAGADGAPGIGEGAYSAGYLWLSGSDPARVLARSEHPFLQPQQAYEKTGQYAAGTVFTEGLAHFKGFDWLYYGTADSYVAGARTH